MILTIQKAKHYLLEVTTLFILQIQMWDGIDASVRRGSIYVGFLIGLFTLAKVVLDVVSRIQDNKLKSLEIRKKELEQNGK